MEVKKQFVVLFQGDNSGQENKYMQLFEEEGIYAKSIPTITFNFINKEKLQNCLQNADSYSGIVFSSTRAVSAVSSIHFCIDNWKKKQNFSVGKATADLAQSTLNLCTCGSDSGNSEKLCQFITEVCGQVDKPLLFPCSNIRKDTIPVHLSQNNIPIEEIISYETIPNVQFENVWQNMISKEGLPGILVFFSPSGVRSCIKIINDVYSDSELPKFIAIGPSTEKALLESGITCKTAEKPTAESVLCAVKEVLDI